MAKAIVEPCHNFAANSRIEAALSGTDYCFFVLRLVRAMINPNAAAMVAPNGTFAPSASPTRQPAQPPPVGGVVDVAPKALDPDDDDDDDDDVDSVGDEFGAAAYIAGAGTSGPLSIFVSLSSRATIATRSNPPRLANANFCAASIPLLCSPPGGPPQMPRCGLAHCMGPVHACRIA